MSIIDREETLNRQTLEEQAYAELQRLIMEGVLHPGDRISVNAIAKRLGVSRLPVIHALRRLATEGFVQIRPHKNVIVTKPTLKEMRGQFLMFAALEEVAVREAWPLSSADRALMEMYHRRLVGELASGAIAEQTDHAFHEVVWRTAGIDHLFTTIETLWNLTAYYRLLVYKNDAQSVHDRIAEHQAILHALETGDIAQTVDRIREHRLRSFERMQRVMAQYL